ncbi:hypothetical protein M8J76_006998 [Diaphorina citri]|nr:hypothetical protein M8J76_006998 [Diaphorina citri]
MDDIGSPMPALILIHGESYEWNSGNPYDGSILASYGHLIVVTVNFRLGVLELLHRVILLSGSGLSPWAIQRDPLAVKRKVAEQTGCHGDLLEDDIAPCLRGKSLQELLDVRLEPLRFLPGFAPFVDGAVIASSVMSSVSLSDVGILSGNKEGPGYELADFPDRDLLFCLTSTESYLDLSAQDLEFGFNETRRDRILRTFVRNAYYFHLNEIFSTLKNEYTDWERPVLSALNYRDATLEVLSDGHTVAPLIRVGHLHALRGGRSYFLHFRHQTSERDYYPQRTGSVRGEDVPYVLGLPLVDGGPFFPHNYSDQDAAISKQLIHYIANFARKGDPNGPTPPASLDPNHQVPFWDTYDSINQLYLELGSKTEIRNHYRGHKMSLWLNLIPQLHRPGVEDLSMRHHNFLEDGVQYYDGSVRPQTLYRPNLLMPEPTTTSRPKATSTTQPTSATAQPDITTTECVNTSLGPAVDMVRPTKDINTNILKKYANNQYQHYATAFIVTITVGLLLLLLNILIMARICRQRENRSREKKKKPKKRKEDIHAGGPDANSISSSSIEEFKHALSESMNPSVSTMVDLPLQDFKCSPPSGTRRPSSGTLGGPDICPPGYESTDVTSPSIPEPPPPPKNQPPPGCPGNPSILRQQNCPQTPPNLMKKRVQIQEISV